MNKRLSLLQKRIQSHQLLLLSSPNDIKYFSDFVFLVPEEREAFLLVTSQNTYLLHMHFSPIPKELGKITPLAGTNPKYLSKHLEDIKNKEDINKIYTDNISLHVNEYLEIKKAKNVQIEELDRQIIWDQRMVKSNNEISNIKKASKITNKALLNAKKTMTVGMTEIELAKIIDEYIRSNNCDLAFPIIVAFGKNTALPHHQPSNTKLKDNMAILIDIGAKYDGYCSDMTRTFWYGDKPNKEFLKIMNTVHEAYDKAILKLKTGFDIDEMTLGGELDELTQDDKNKPNDKKSTDLNSTPAITAKTIDNAARDHISDVGFAKEFIHTTGHGLGLDIHEPPSLSWRNKQKLVAGMVVTVEPGIYLLGKIGYRYENSVVLK